MDTRVKYQYKEGRWRNEATGLVLGLVTCGDTAFVMARRLAALIVTTAVDSKVPIQVAATTPISWINLGRRTDVVALPSRDTARTKASASDICLFLPIDRAGHCGSA